MKIKLEVSELVASCLQRMIVDEIDNQKMWSEEGEDSSARLKARKAIIVEMEDLADQLKKQGIRKYIKCY